MNPELRLTPRQEQRLALTPQVRLGLQILQMPLPELTAFVEQQLEENPVLEASRSLSPSSLLPSVGPNEAFGRMDVAAIEQLEQEDEPVAHTDQEEDQAKQAFRAQFPTQPTTLADHLRRQLHCLELTPAEQMLGENIVENLDSNGYLAIPLEELAQEMGTPLADAERVLGLIQELDPPGVGARDLRECLLSQLRSCGKEGALAFQIVRDHFELVKKRDLKAIARHCSVPLEEVWKTFHEIQTLDPKPGRAYGATPAAVLVPDAMIECVDGTYEVSLRREEIPRLRISRYYRHLLKDPTAPDEVRQYLKDKVDGALWLMKAIGQRNLTLKEILRCIASLEEEFLDNGPAYLKPLTLEQVAQLVGRHKSTVSRAIANKYVETPAGLMRLEAFFGGGVKQDTGEAASHQRIQAELLALIDEEDPRNPLRDHELVEQLKARGLTVARRTIAKYRESLKILPAHLRKRTPERG